MIKTAVKFSLWSMVLWAIAGQAIMAENLPDLVLSTTNIATSDITISKAIPKEGQEVTIRGNIHNQGKEEATQVVVRFFDGNPKAGGRQIGADQIIDRISPAQAKETEIKCALSPNGFHDIFVVVDPDNKIPELSENNNQASLEVPVVVKDLYFYGWGLSSEKDLRYANKVRAAVKKEDIEYWLHRGCIPCAWKGARVDLKKPEEEEIARLVKYWGEDAVKEGYPGISIDEIGCYPGTLPTDYAPEQKAIIALKALRETKKKYPDLFIAVANAGNLNAVECAGYREAADLVKLEIYSNWFRGFKTHQFYRYIDERIEMARNLDVLLKTIVILSVCGYHGGITLDEVEEQVRYVKRTGPEMPGIAFYASGRTTNWGMKMGIPKFVDYMCYKYYVLPVLTLVSESDITFSNYHPKNGEKVTIYAVIHNTGGMDAHDVLLNFYEGDPATSRRKKIGERKISLLPAGQKVVEEDWGDKEKFKSLYPPGQEKVEVIWNAKAGYHDIWVEIISRGRGTILDGQATKKIYVSE